MINKNVAQVLIVVLSIMFVFVGCSSGAVVAMPYSSKEYVDLGWSIETMKKHFKDLGIENIEVWGNTTSITNVYIENDDGKMESFDKGDEIVVTRVLVISTDYEFKSSLTVSNNEDVARFVKNGIDSKNDSDAWMDFLKNHSGEYFEFDGTIIEWYDKQFWNSISFSVAIEDSEYMTFSKDTVELDDLGMTGDYHYNKYYSGLIRQGMRVHVVTKIVNKDGWGLELCSMEVIEE